MNETTKKMLAELDAAILECLWVPNESLPEGFQDNREGGKTLKRLHKQLQPEQEVDPRQAHVVISNGQIKYGNQERIDVLNKYQADVEAGREIEYDVNEYKLHKNLMAFCSAMNVDLEPEE